LSADALKNGTADNPMTVYVAPYVYWIDDPAATATATEDRRIFSTLWNG